MSLGRMFRVAQDDKSGAVLVLVMLSNAKHPAQADPCPLSILAAQTFESHPTFGAYLFPHQKSCYSVRSTIGSGPSFAQFVSRYSIVKRR